MSEIEAYCIQLGRNVDIFEARSEFFDQDEPKKRFDFLCSNKDCREIGVKMVGVNYDKLPKERKVSPHFKYQSRNNISHTPGCWYYQNKILERIEGKSNKADQNGRYRKKLKDVIDEFIIEDLNEVNNHNHISNIDDMNGNNLSKISKNRKSNNQNSGIQRYAQTSRLARLIEFYLDAKRNCKNDEFLQIPLKVKGTNIQYLYQYFRRIDKVIKEKIFCVCIGEFIFYKNKNGDLIFKFDNDKIDLDNLYLRIKSDVLEKYRYKKSIQALTQGNHRYKTYFIPRKEDLELKKVNKNGKEIDYYCFDIKNLSHCCFYFI